MPRGRFLSKDISLDEKVNALSDDTARLLFTWLIPHLDCEGRLHGDPTTVKSIVFPRRKISVRKVEKYLQEIAEKKLILRYSVDGNAYLLSPHFEKHQVGLQKSKEAQSQIPPPPPELLQSYSRVTPPQVEAEVKAKVKAKVEDAPVASFVAYKEKLRVNYPELDIEEEWERCQIWYRDHKKSIKSPSLALGNWCKKEMEIKKDKKGGQSGAHKQSSRRLPKVYRPPEVIFGDKDG
ncbi:hypothetical protein ES703_05400 [subsurface metagenome]